MLKTKKIPCPFRPEHTKRSQKSKFLYPTKRKKIFFATLVFVSVFTAQNNVFKLETHISMHLRLSSTLTDHLKRKEKYIEYIWNECFGQRFQKPPFSLVFGEKERFQNAFKTVDGSLRVHKQKRNQSYAISNYNASLV